LISRDTSHVHAFGVMSNHPPRVHASADHLDRSTEDVMQPRWEDMTTPLAPDIGERRRARDRHEATAGVGRGLRSRGRPRVLGDRHPIERDPLDLLRLSCVLGAAGFHGTRTGAVPVSSAFPDRGPESRAAA
jgi:hypothetical protein